jgi:hypothetical protein
MRYWTRPSILLAGMILTSCSAAGPDLDITNPSNASFLQSEGFLSIVADGVDQSLPRYPDYDRGTFIAATDTEGRAGEGYILAISETDNTFAAYLLTRNEGATSQSYIGRTVTAESLPTGTASLTGTYVGSFVNEDEDTLRAYISGDASIDINFDAMTIEGMIENRTTRLYGLPFEFTLEEDLSTIELVQTDILRDGAFAGTSEYMIPSTDEGDKGVTNNVVSFAGLIGGASSGAPEVVGEIEVERTTTDIRMNANFESTSLETGVFAVGHADPATIETSLPTP